MKVRISYFSNYLRYLIARTFFRSLLELLGPLILDYYGNSSREEAHDVHIIFGIVGVFSLYLLLHSQVFFSELKVIVADKTTGYVNPETNLGQHLAKIRVYLLSKGTHILLAISFIFLCNPVSAGLPVFIDSIPGKGQYTQLMLSSVIQGVVISLGLILVRQKVRRITYPGKIMVLMNSALLLIGSLSMWTACTSSLQIAPALTLLTIFQGVNNLFVIFNCLVIVGEISKVCETGFESFSINFITGVLNIAVFISTFVGTKVVSFLQGAHYAPVAINYSAILNLELMAIPLLIGLHFYFIRDLN